MTNTELWLLFIISCTWLSCICNYFRVSKLEEEIHSLKLRNKFVQDDLHALIKNVEKLVKTLILK